MGDENVQEMNKGGALGFGECFLISLLENRNPERVLENTREPRGGDATKCGQGLRQKHSPFVGQSGNAGSW